MKPDKHNMQRLFAVICVLGLLQSPTTAMAQAAIAMKAGVVGVKVLIGLVGVAEGKPFEINSIFGNQRPDARQPLTAEELGAALDKSLAKSFRSEYLKTTLDQVTELQEHVREYNSDGVVASRREQIAAIILNADKIRAAIQNRIHHGDFFKLLPDFMMATNTWLAFETERKFVTVNEDTSLAKRKAAYEHQNQIVAFEVVHALRLLHEFYYHDFIDTGKRDCIYKKPGQHLTNRQGENIPYFDSQIYIKKFGLKVCGLTGEDMALRFNNLNNNIRRFLGPVRYMEKSVVLPKMFPNSAWHTNYRVFKKNKNEWVYTFKTKGKYTYYGPFKTKADAEASRVARAMMSYRDILGDIPGMVRQWEKLVLAIGTHQNKSDAIRLVNELGVRKAKLSWSKGISHGARH
jgi:hypothetical protein